jgi:hypothetical protein
MKSSVKHARLDQLGITASIACAIHCAALPLAITALPLLGLEFLADIRVEVSMICLSLVVGIYSIGGSYPKHRKVLPIFILIIGFLLIGTGHFIFGNLEAIIVPMGGFTIAAAHLVNWKYGRRCKHQ